MNKIVVDRFNDRKECPKCGEAPRTDSESGIHNWDRDYFVIGSSTELLIVRCTKCGYAWYEHTKDHKGDTENE